MATNEAMNYIPVSDWAKECFGKYEKQGFKIYRESDSGILFVNSDCDITSHQSYVDTMMFGFWMDKNKDVVRRET